MTKIEAIFGGVLLLFVVGAISLVAFDRMGMPTMGQGAGARNVTRASTIVLNEDNEPSVFSGNFNQDVCTCYENGFSTGGQQLPIQSVQYKSGYSSCRSALGVAGGEAWTQGWALGQKGKLTQRSCKIYLKRLAVAKIK